MVGPVLSGEKVNLRPLREHDLTRRAEWLNDEETVRLFTGFLPARTYDRTDAGRWRATLEADMAALVWAIETKSGRHIGDVDLHNIDRRAGVAKLTILLGDKAYWCKGCGSDAIKALLHHAFGELDLNSVALRVYDFNKRAIRCYEKCGFEQTRPGWSDWRFASEPGEIQMIVTRECFLTERPDASTIHA